MNRLSVIETNKEDLVDMVFIDYKGLSQNKIEQSFGNIQPTQEQINVLIESIIDSEIEGQRDENANTGIIADTMTKSTEEGHVYKNNVA